MEYQKKFSQNQYSEKIPAGDTWNKNRKHPGLQTMLREGYDPPISRSLEAMNAWCIPQPYESGALTS